MPLQMEEKGGQEGGCVGHEWPGWLQGCRAASASQAENTGWGSSHLVLCLPPATDDADKTTGFVFFLLNLRRLLTQIDFSVVKHDLKADFQSVHSENWYPTLSAYGS